MTDKLENYYKNYNYNNRKPIYIDEKDLRADQHDRLFNSDYFCMIPWIHMHGFPDGRAYPCCLANMDHPIGNLKTHSMREIWNSLSYKEMRSNMLQDKPCKECSKCYENESNGFVSMRESTNKNFGQHINIVDQTLEDGTFDEFKLRYYDIRFSNLCNFSCRTCGSIFSSNWYKDEVAAGWNVNHPMVMYAGFTEDSMWEQMQEHIPNLEQIYFAGGEPLIMKEHWMILDELVKRKMFHVRLCYNTNFSELKYKGRDVLEMWKLFDCVSIGASLDGSYARGEYIRKGQDWKQTISNRQRMLNICPNVDFYVSATVSLMNVIHISDFHRELIEQNLIRPMDFNINLLQHPTRFRVDVLPQKFKDIATEKIQKHIEWLEPQDSLTRATTGFRGIIAAMNQTDNSNLLREFFEVNNKIDIVRKEKFEDVFPEYKELRNYIT